MRMKACAGLVPGLLLVAATAVLATSCGAEGRKENPDDPAAAAADTVRAQSWRVVETTVMREPYFEKTESRGVVDARRHRSWMRVDLGPASKEDSPQHVVNGRVIGEEIQIGSVVYFGGGLADGSEGKPWTKIDHGRASENEGEPEPEFDAGDPAEELELLRSVSADFRLVGKEHVRGIELSHYRGSMNVGAVEGTWDIWVGDHRIRRTRFTDPEGSFVSTTDYYDFGVQARIEAPPPHLVEDETETLRPSPKRCDVPGEPITIGEAARSLRKHGFSVFREPDSASCGGAREDEHVLTTLTNILFEGPHENIDSHGAIGENEGHLICTVRRRPIYGREAQVQDHTERGEEASLVLANLECGLYPEDARERAPHERRLREALRDLQTNLQKK